MADREGPSGALPPPAAGRPPEPPGPRTGSGGVPGRRDQGLAGLGDRGAAGSGLTPAELAAALAALAWLAISAVWLLSPGAEGQGPLRLVVALVAVVLPVVMIAVAVASARAARLVRAEARELRAALDAMRRAGLADRQARAAVAAPPAPAASAPPVRAAAPHSPGTGRATRSGPPSGAEQPRLALGEEPGQAAPLARADLIRALNFPDDPKDGAGFAALRRALAARSARVLIQASQDVLTLLSQDGIYMDDLRPDPAPPEAWRRFARGERGPAVAALGGVRDGEALALVAGRMREDPVFRDAAHHFLRLFDRALHGLEPEATDEELAALAETRTGRAFVLLGRVAGSFAGGA